MFNLYHFIRIRWRQWRGVCCTAAEAQERIQTVRDNVFRKGYASCRDLIVIEKLERTVRYGK